MSYGNDGEQSNEIRIWMDPFITLMQFDRYRSAQIRTASRSVINTVFVVQCVLNAFKVIKKRNTQQNS